MQSERKAQHGFPSELTDKVELEIEFELGIFRIQAWITLVQEKGKIEIEILFIT